MCTAMLYDPKDHLSPKETAQDFKENSSLYERFMRLKANKMMRFLKKKKAEKNSLLHFFLNF